MRNLWYSPSVEAYAEHVGPGGSHEFMDMSRDVTSCSVRLMEGGAGTASLSLSNDGNKWAGRILPMDVICVYATAQHGRVRLFTGYVTSLSGFSLYSQDFRITATDALYRLQRIYWDPVLYASYEMSTSEMADPSLMGTSDGGMGAQVAKIMSEVGGCAPSSIYVQDVPIQVADWACSMYEDDSEGRSSQSEGLSSLSDVVRSMTSSAASGASSSGSTSHSSSAHSGGVSGIVDSAMTQLGLPYLPGGSDPSDGGMDCSGLVCWSYAQNGVSLTSMGARTADEITNLPHVELTQESAGPGDLVSWYGYYGGYGRTGQHYFHIAVYCGDGTIVEEMPGAGCQHVQVGQCNGCDPYFFHLSALDGGTS